MRQFYNVVMIMLFFAVIPGIAFIPASAATFSVITNGATPNDISDDLAAINNTITAASSGDTVYFPTGTYRVSGSVVGKSGVRLEGATGSILLYNGSVSECIISLYGKSNVTVTGLILDGNNSSTVRQGIAAGSGSGLRLEYLTIRNIGNAEPHGIRFDPDVTDSVIANNTIANIGTGSAWGAGIRISWRSSRNVVENNTISNTGRGGILCNDDSTDLVIRNNTITGSGLIAERLGIELWGGCHRGVVEGNTIDHWLSLDSSNYCAVRRNTVSDKSGAYAWAGLEAISQNCVFADNLVDGGAQVGISQSNWQTKEYLIFVRNTIKASATFGLMLGGVDGPCQYQYFYQNKFLSSIGTQPPAQYSGCGDGMRFDQNCYYISFESNEISNNYHDGIWPMWSRENLNYFSFMGNTIQNNGNGGVWDGFGNDLEWTGNIVSGNHSGGADWNVQPTSRGFANQKPVAAFTCPTTVLPGTVVSFTNTSSDPDGSIGHVLWDFGDGLPSTSLSPTHTYTNLGNYVVALVVWDNLGRGKLTTRNITVNTAPTISISAPSLSLTKSSSVTYTITYGGASSVTLANASVTLNKTATANGTVAVSGTGNTTRTVTISGITGDGTLGISISAGTASDTGGNFAPAAGPSTTFTVDNTAPTISIGSRSTPLTKSGPVMYTITYGGANSITLAAGNVTLNKTGTASATVTISGTSSTTRTVSISSITGNGTLGISIAAGTASDTAGNSAPAVGPSDTFTVDNTAPTVTSIVRKTPLGQYYDGSSVVWTVTFNETIKATTVSTGDFTLTDVSSSIMGESITSVSPIIGTTTAFDVTCSTGTGNGMLRLDVIGSTAAINDQAGNDITASFTTGESYIISTITAHVKLNDWTSVSSVTLPFHVEYRKSGTLDVMTLVDMNLLVTPDGGVGTALLSLLGFSLDTYDIWVKCTHWLTKMTPGVNVLVNPDMGNVTLINGDVVDNNEVDFSDINAVRAAYGSFPEDDTWNDQADVDGSGEVDFTDINIVRSKYGEIGE